MPRSSTINYYISHLVIHFCFCLIKCLCLVGTDPANSKSGSDLHSVRPIKRKEPIKVDISVKVVPKPRKVSKNIKVRVVQRKSTEGISTVQMP